MTDLISDFLEHKEKESSTKEEDKTDSKVSDIRSPTPSEETLREISQHLNELQTVPTAVGEETLKTPPPSPAEVQYDVGREEKGNNHAFMFIFSLLYEGFL